MPRPRLLRRIGFLPSVTYFKPAGIPLATLAEETITFDEFEALRLSDLEEFDQEKSAAKMKISQPTFHRLITTARKKIASALVNGKAIKVKGGNYQMPAARGFGIRRARFRRGFGRGGRGFGRSRRGFGGPATSCICLNCNYQIPKQAGIPCSTIKCPKCGALMVRS